MHKLSTFCLRPILKQVTFFMKKGTNVCACLYILKKNRNFVRKLVHLGNV